MPDLPRQSQGIASWPEDERPRERLLKREAEALTDAELVAILLRVGVKGASAVELARRLLEKFGSLRAMAAAPTLALLDIKGLKGCEGGEVGRGMINARNGYSATTITSPNRAAAYDKSNQSHSAISDFRKSRPFPP